MQIILLSGGSGKRLWPLSNDLRSKQFIQIFKTPEGSYESMIQRVYRQIQSVDPEANITIATAKNQVAAIKNQLGSSVEICVEPCRRDTLPAIALASAYLYDVLGVKEDEPVIVCPVDPFVNEDYFEALKALSNLTAQSGGSSITLLGIEPTYPSAKYGYIKPQTKDLVSKVESFKEKPSESAAQKLIEQGSLWNAGVFAFKLGYALKKAHDLVDFKEYWDLRDIYSTLPSVSFDYEVIEKESNISVMRFGGEWKDLGTWNTITEAMDEPTIGKAILDKRCKNVNVINDLTIPILCMGLKDVVVSASAQGILVSDKETSSYIKEYVDNISQEVMFAQKSWGEYRVLEVGEKSMTIRVNLHKDHQMNYHSHDNRNEVWTIIDGEGRTIIDGMEQHVHPGDVITILSGCKHTIIALSELTLIEVQLGDNISVHDKKKHTL